MKKLYNAKNILILCTALVIVFNIVVYFMPFYSKEYSASYNNDKTTTYFHLYSEYSYILPFSAMTFITPILAIACLLASFKNSKPFAYAFSASNFMNNILLLLTIKSYIIGLNDNSSSNSYTYDAAYGYNMCLFVTILLGLLLVSIFVVHCVIKYKSHEQKPLSKKEDQYKTDATIFMKKIEILDALKENGALTQNEYDQKRSDIIKDLKL